MSLTENQKLELKKLKKEITPLIKTAAYNEGIVPLEDYRVMAGTQEPSAKNVSELLNDPGALKKFIPKLKNRLDKRRKLLSECKRKKKTLSLKSLDLVSSEMKRIEDSLKEHSIFDKSDFLKNLTTDFDKHFTTESLLEDLLEKNKESIRNSDRFPTDDYTFTEDNKQWLLKDVIVEKVKNNPKQASSYISQLRLSIDMLDKLNSWLKSSHYTQLEVRDNLIISLGRYKERNEKLMNLHDMKLDDINEKQILDSIPEKERFEYVLVEGLKNIRETLKNAPIDFTCNGTIKPIVQQFKKDVKNSAEKLSKRAIELFSANTLNKVVVGQKPPKIESSLFKPKKRN